MKHFIISFQLIFFILFFAGCEIENPFKPSKQEMQLKEKELSAKIEQDKQKLNLQKELELAKINNDLEKEKINSNNKEKEALYQLQLQKAQSEIELQKYMILLAALVIIILAFAVYVYFNNRRKDKLKAYEDNMEKYFKSKENEAKVKIANKIIDTIATGNLNKDQEKLLISNLDGKENISAKALKGIQNEDVVDAEIINLASPQNENQTSPEKKKKTKKKEKKNKKKSKEE